MDHAGQSTCVTGNVWEPDSRAGGITLRWLVHCLPAAVGVEVVTVLSDDVPAGRHAFRDWTHCGALLRESRYAKAELDHYRP